MIFYKQYYPSAALAEVVECYWILQSPAGFIHKPDRLIPGGRVELMFNFGEPVYWLMDDKTADNGIGCNAFIVGQRNRIYYAKSTGRTCMIGLRFKPGGIAAFTNMPVSLLLNTVVPAEDIFGNIVKSWTALLFEQPTNEKKMALLDTLMLQAKQAIPADYGTMHYAVDMLRTGDDAVSIKSICDTTGWYYKKLERAFLKTTGYTPKYYSKITRFNKALRLMQGEQSLTGICYQCNYFDQSHFIKDFHEFAGTSPNQFKKEDNKIASLLIKHQPV